jgi:hypothetical protein
MGGIQLYSNEGDSPSPRGDNSESKNTPKFLKNFLQNDLAEINQSSYKLSLDEGNSSFFT